MSSLPSHFVLPDGPRLVLMRWTGTGLAPSGRLGLPPSDRPTATNDRWVVAVPPKGRSVHCWRIHTGGPVDHRVLPLPDRTEVHAVALVGDTLYVGGARGDETLCCWDLSESEPARRPIALPDNIRAPGKAIDGLLHDADRLIAVDDIVFPKWNLVYDIQTPTAPILQSMHRIPGHGSYEQIVSAALGDTHVALLSSSVGRSGSYRHIALLDRSSLRECGAITVGRSLHQDVRQLDWRALSFSGSRLLIAAGTDGLLSLDLAAVSPPPDPGPPANETETKQTGQSRRRTLRKGRQAFAKAALDGLRQHPLPAGEAVGVTPLPDSSQLLVRTQQGEAWGWCLVDPT